jgi:CRP/FNR family transcriptional regulator, cyclic AMP receptor protein
MLETSTAQPLLGLDPDLGVLLAPERMQAASEDLQVRVTGFDPGPWRPESMCGASPANVGLLVLSGVVSREICLHDAPSAELLGSGDIIRTWQADAQPGMLRTSVRWIALSRTRLALLDRDTALALRRYPEVMTVVLDRLNARAERLAVTQAISQITGVETRVEALLWHLSERWGRIGSDGVIVPLMLSHRMIGSLVGARRPTVSTAIAQLVQQERIARREDGSWVLTGQPLPAPAPARHLELAGDDHADEARRNWAAMRTGELAAP